MRRGAAVRAAGPPGGWGPQARGERYEQAPPAEARREATGSGGAFRSTAAIRGSDGRRPPGTAGTSCRCAARSEEHTSELQSRLHLVCRLLLEKKKKKTRKISLKHEQ